MNVWMATVAISLGASIAATAHGEWRSDYAVALSTARAPDRPLLILLEKPNDPSQSLGSEALTGSEPWSTLDRKYELCRVDVTTNMGKKVRINSLINSLTGRLPCLASFSTAWSPPGHMAW